MIKMIMKNPDNNRLVVIFGNYHNGIHSVSGKGFGTVYRNGSIFVRSNLNHLGLEGGWYNGNGVLDDDAQVSFKKEKAAYRLGANVPWGAYYIDEIKSANLFKSKKGFWMLNLKAGQPLQDGIRLLELDPFTGSFAPVSAYSTKR